MNALAVALAVFIGAFAAVAAALLRLMVDFIGLCGDKLDAAFDRSLPGGLSWLQLAFVVPFIGIFLSFLFQRTFCSSRYAKSLSPLILALHRHKTRIKFPEIFTHLFSAALAVGAGGSAGLEAPSVLSGAAIGSVSSSLFSVGNKYRMLFIGCGAASAISAIFGSPIGGVLFAVEVLLPEFSVGALVPMLMASGVATVVSRLIFPDSGETIFKVVSDWRIDAVPFYLLLGVVSAVIGIYVIKSSYWLNAKLKKHFISAWRRLFFGGFTLCVILTIFPVLRGQGYNFIERAFSGDADALVKAAPLLNGVLSPAWVLVLILLAAIFLKSTASVLTVESGGDGGIFAPTMFIGAFTGFAFARLVNLTGFVELNEANFLVVGMCGVFTSVMRAPLTGVFLIAEVCGGYQLLVPLMIVSALSWIFSRPFEPNSIYRKVLAENNLLVDDPDLAMLKRLPVRLNLDNCAPALKPEISLMSAAFVLEEKKNYQVFPVLDESGKLCGTISRAQLNSALLDPQMANELVVFDLMKRPVGVLSVDDDLALAMTILEKSGADFLPVVGENELFRGFLFRTEIFEQYRQLVRESGGL